MTASLPSDPSRMQICIRNKTETCGPLNQDQSVQCAKQHDRYQSQAEKELQHVVFPLNSTVTRVTSTSSHRSGKPGAEHSRCLHLGILK